MIRKVKKEKEKVTSFFKGHDDVGHDGVFVLDGGKRHGVSYPCQHACSSYAKPFD